MIKKNMSGLWMSKPDKLSYKEQHRHEKGGAMASDLSRDFDYAERPKHSPTWQLARDIGETIILTLIMFLVIRLAVQDFQVDGTSMEPTLQDRQFVLVDKLTYTFNAPQRGDVIVFEYPRDHHQNYIKRIIGIPGDKVYVAQNGTVSVNGVTLSEPYTNPSDNPYADHAPVTLDPNTYFVLGDNRGFSSDSRDWGSVSRGEIIGKATLVYWPLNVLHFLPNEQTVYSQVAVAPSTTLKHSMATSMSGAVHEAGLFTPYSAMMVILVSPGAYLFIRSKRQFFKTRSLKR
jgi:signal peptidase I